ncbi:hypothetical protein J2T50_001852 [Streptococcus gallinaceus]|nr:hypothetical protein [Streptococcus gallinaceus]MCP1770911.1 hypothetical protein [Streptococcus gallinaceus]
MTRYFVFYERMCYNAKQFKEKIDDTLFRTNQTIDYC